MATTNPPTRSPHHRARTAWFAGGVAVGALVVTAAAIVVGILLGDRPFARPEMADTFTGLDATIGPTEDTARLCADIPCDEGWQTDVGDFRRFSTEDLAEFWAIVLGGETYRNGTVLLDLNGLDLTQAQRQLAVELLYPGRDWNVVPWSG